MFGMLPEYQVERIFEDGLVFADDVRWAPQPSNPNWIHFEGFLDSPRDVALRLNMAVSLLREERYRILIRRGEQILRRLDVRGSHLNPPGSDEVRWDSATHKHSWTDQFGDKVAYSPAEITTDAPFDRSEYESTFLAFCEECNIDFKGVWSEPPAQQQAQLNI